MYIETDKGSGTGFMFSEKGYAITCAHVINGASEIYVRVGTNENDVEQAKVISVDTCLDLAIIKTEQERKCCAILDIDREAELGEEIVILGFPFGAKMSDDVSKMSVSFTRGYVSSKQVKDEKKRTMLDIAAKAGNSGSPVISLETGGVVGVLSGSITGGVKNMEEVNYMIPIDYVLELMED